MVVDYFRVAVAQGVGVLHPVRTSNREAISVVEDVSILHVGRVEANFYPASGKLSRNVIFLIVDLDGTVCPYLAFVAIEECFLQPFPRFRYADIALCVEVAVNRALLDAGMEGLIVNSDVFLKLLVELLQGMDINEENLSVREVELLKMYRSMKPEQKECIVQISKCFVKNQVS